MLQNFNINLIFLVYVKMIDLLDKIVRSHSRYCINTKNKINLYCSIVSKLAYKPYCPSRLTASYLWGRAHLFASPDLCAINELLMSASRPFGERTTLSTTSSNSNVTRFCAIPFTYNIYTRFCVLNMCLNYDLKLVLWFNVEHF